MKGFHLSRNVSKIYAKIWFAFLRIIPQNQIFQQNLHIWILCFYNQKINILANQRSRIRNNQSAKIRRNPLGQNAGPKTRTDIRVNFWVWVCYWHNLVFIIALRLKTDPLKCGNPTSKWRISFGYPAGFLG